MGCFIQSLHLDVWALVERQNRAAERLGHLFWTRVIILSCKRTERENTRLCEVSRTGPLHGCEPAFTVFTPLQWIEFLF